MNTVNLVWSFITLMCEQLQNHFWIRFKSANIIILFVTQIENKVEVG